MAYKIFRPRRGKKSYMDSSGTILAKGEMFFEVPESGVGTGNCKVKMGDGVSDYATLPYAIDAEAIDVSTSEITFSESTSTTNSVLLGEIVSGATVASLFGSIKKLLSNLSDSVTELNNDSSNYALKSNLTDGSVTKLGTSTYGSTSKPIYWNAGVPAAISSTVGGSTTPIYSNAGTLTACSLGTTYAPYSDIYSPVLYEYFSDIPDDSYNRFCYVNYKTGTDSSAPDTTNYADWWWDTLSYGTSSRKVQITSCPFRNRSSLYFRQKHDSNWYGWYTLLSSDNYSSYAMPISGSTFTGVAYAQSNTSYTTYQLRNIAFTTSTPSSLTNGYVCMVYS